MDSENKIPSTSMVKCCEFECTTCSMMNKTWLRSVKRKFDEYDEKFVIPGLDLPQPARIDLGNECAALREVVSSQQETIHELSVELEEERNAASSAANEAMSMILRLQREKAEALMEFRQFKRFSEEKMAHDQQEIMELEDFLYKREEAIQSLSCEVQMYKHRMLSYGLLESEIEDDNELFQDYPPLKCTINENQVCLEEVDVEKHAFDNNVLEKEIVVQSPFLADESVGKDESSQTETKVEESSEVSDRVYTIASMHKGSGYNGNAVPKSSGRIVDSQIPKGSPNHTDFGDPEVTKLYVRLQALEADRESMRQAILSMQTDKAQMILLKEIAQQLCKEMTPVRRVTPVRKPSILTSTSFSFMSIFKWIISFVWWRSRARRSKYLFGLTANKAGLLMLLDKGPHVGQWRCLSSTQVCPSTSTLSTAHSHECCMDC